MYLYVGEVRPISTSIFDWRPVKIFHYWTSFLPELEKEVNQLLWTLVHPCSLPNLDICNVVQQLFLRNGDSAVVTAAL